MTRLLARTVSKGMARMLMGFTLILLGFIFAVEISLYGVQASSVGFNVFLSFSIGFITSGVVLAVEGAIERLS